MLLLCAYFSLAKNCFLCVALSLFCKHHRIVPNGKQWICNTNDIKLGVRFNWKFATDKRNLFRYFLSYTLFSSLHYANRRCLCSMEALRSLSSYVSTSHSMFVQWIKFESMARCSRAAHKDRFARLLILFSAIFFSYTMVPFPPVQNTMFSPS